MNVSKQIEPKHLKYMDKTTCRAPIVTFKTFAFDSSATLSWFASDAFDADLSVIPGASEFKPEREERQAENETIGACIRFDHRTRKLAPTNKDTLKETLS